MAFMRRTNQETRTCISAINCLTGPMGFGAAPQGIPDDEAVETVEGRLATRYALFRYGAPLFGAGLSEIRLGKRETNLTSP